ncbi:hypothetical protein GTQ34_15895 [Muricauda sp. JGD-17]|uniref:HTH LytTR-type domain-containing protein n=1 Tax=Flagellimonas ochracea TaxID=2696472 RepID=A0A964TFL4_9FLAO|nr:hypothetical protein [Allomuricauda ochracea]
MIDVFVLISLTIYFINSTTGNLKSKPAISSIHVKNGTKEVFLQLNDIFWISANGYYITFHSSRGKFLVRRGLKNMLKSLPRENFVQIHRSAIINLKYLHELRKKSSQGFEVLMANGDTHAVSRTYKKVLKTILDQTGY